MKKPIAMPGRNSTGKMGDDSSFHSKGTDLERPKIRSKSPNTNFDNIDLVYNTVPEHTNTVELKTSIIKTKFSRDKKDTIQSKKESIPSKDEMAERSKTSIKSRFSICKSPIVTDETTGAIIEFSTGEDIVPAPTTSYSKPKDSNLVQLGAYHTVTGAAYRSRYSPQRNFEPLKSERSIERRLRRVTETEEDLPSPIKSPTAQQQPMMEQVKEEESKMSPKVSRFLVTKTALKADENQKQSLEPSITSNIEAISSYRAEETSTGGKNCSLSDQSKDTIFSKEVEVVPRKPLLKHSISIDAAGGGSSGSSSCSSVTSNKSSKANKMSLVKASNAMHEEDPAGNKTKPSKSARTSNVSFGKEVIYLDGAPVVGTPPPQSRQRSRSDASATLTKLRQITFRRKESTGVGKGGVMKEKQSSSKQSKDMDSKTDANNEGFKPTHQRTHSCEISSSAGIKKEKKVIDVSLDKPPEKIRPRSRSDKLQKSPKTKETLEEVSTKTSFDWPLGRLGKLRQKYSGRKKQNYKTSHRRKSKGNYDETSSKLSKKSKSIEAISKAHHPVSIPNKKTSDNKKDEDGDLVYDLPEHYQTVLPVIISRVTRPVMGLFRQNSSKGKLKKNKRDRQRHPTDSETGQGMFYRRVISILLSTNQMVTMEFFSNI